MSQGFADKELARRAQKAAVAARKRNRELKGFLAGHKVFSEEVSTMARELVDAALGRGEWGQEYEVVVYRSETDGQVRTTTKVLPVLDAKERAGLIVKCLEFGMGRPGTTKTASGEKTAPDPEPPQEGFEVT